MSDSSNNRTSVLVNSQVPEFVRNEHQTFVKFLEYYYRYLEQDGKQLYVSKNLVNFLDIDHINADVQYDKILGDEHSLREEGDYHAFLQKMYDNFITFIPDTVITDRVNLLKHAKEFYTSRGSEKSVRFLMRALYNKEVEFYYPKSDILRASDGKWFIEKSLKITNIQVNNSSNSLAVTNFADHKIYGSSSKATATVERVDVYFDKGQQVYELKISSAYREFLNDERIYTYYTEEGNDKFLSANLFSGVITAVTINEGGSGYTEGASVNVASNGSGAQIVISKVTKGIIQSVGVSFGGAGFKIDDPIVISGGGGTGANANVSNVNANGFYHPNSYNVMWTTIGLEANTAINNTRYSNLVSSIVDPANAWMTNSMSFFAYSNCGPAVSCFVINTGNNYVPPLALTISANSIISLLGILGRMEIVNGGSNYAANDKIEFLNPIGSTGSGAYANVTSVDANGKITQVNFISQPGQIIGGSGYDYTNLPKANVISATGNGANIMVTAIIGQNERLVAANSSIGTIQEISIITGGAGYIDNPVLRLDQLGDGLANATLTVVTGAYSYPGRYINDDGHISSYNFLEDRDYYQNFSYVVKIDESINKYRKPLKSLIHPAGSKLFGEYLLVDDTQTNSNTNVSVSYAKTESNTKFFESYFQVQGYVTGVFAPQIESGSATVETITAPYSTSVSTSNLSGTYAATNNTIRVYSPIHGYSANDYVYLQFTSNAWANLADISYLITSANANYLTVTNPLSETVSGNTGNVTLYDPKISIDTSHSRPSVGDIVHLGFGTGDASLTNGMFSVYSTPTANVFRVLHPYPNVSSVVSSDVVVKTHKLIVSANSHGFTNTIQSFVLFIGGDSANAVNTYYSVDSVSDSNTFNIVTQNIVMSTTSVRVYRSKSDIVITNHAAANGSYAYITFVNSTLSNVTNGVYATTKVGANRFTVNTSIPATANSDVRVWYSQNNYSNIEFTKEAHGFIANDNVWVEFFTSSTDLANGNYTVKASGANTYNIYYNANTYVNTTSNTIVYSGLGVKTNSKMEGAASVGLYK